MFALLSNEGELPFWHPGHLAVSKVAVCPADTKLALFYFSNNKRDKISFFTQSGRRLLGTNVKNRLLDSVEEGEGEMI